MGTYGNFNLVMREWKLGNITEAQAIGQILQLLEELEKRVAELERLTKPPRVEKEIKANKEIESK